MSFTFRALHLVNWLAYSGRTTISFPDFQPGRNLIVIHGQNGYGKTSLLRALRYVFEGERLSKDELLNLWHEGARTNGDGTLEVALEFTHGGRQCKIVRGCDFETRGESLWHSPRVDLFFDGRREKDFVEDKIQELLPRDCLDFIFFDGAEISRYSQGENKAETKEAIEKILGIPAARNLRDDLGDLIKNLEREQRDLLEKSGQSTELLLEIAELEEELDRYRQRRSEQMDRKRSQEKVRTELEAEREQIRAIEKDRDTLKEKKRRKADLDERIDRHSEEMRSLIGHLPLFMLEEPLRQVREEMRAKESVPPKIQELDARLRTLKQLVDEATCLCGEEIDDEIRARLQSQLSSLEQQLGDRALGSNGPSEDFRDLDALLRSLRARTFEPDDLIDRHSMLADERDEVEAEIARMDRDLKDHLRADVSDLSEQLGMLNQQIEGIEAEIRSIEENAQRTGQELVEKNREVDRLAVIDDKAKGVTRTLQEAKRAEKAISEVLNQMVEEKREIIEAHATKVFRSITNKPEEYDRLKLRGDYSLELLRRDGSTVSNDRLSAGEKEVIAYSFITALNLASADPAPFVMDTPFGHLDSGHRRGLLNSLPDLQVQAFLLATDRDLPPAERDTIDSALAKEYVLKRNQQVSASSIEEDG